MTAVEPSVSMRAPIRSSSATCMKRFSKIVSVTRDWPSARPSSVMTCACMSVGKPGNGLVITSAGPGRSGPRTRTEAAPTSRLTPHSSSLASTAERCSGTSPVTVTSPPVIAPATIRVPASMRSGSTRWVVPPSSVTPSISIRSVPAPWIWAPIAFKSAARSPISGSRAAFSITVVPEARAAAIIRFSVPVTVTRSVVMRAPFNRLARATT